MSDQLPISQRAMAAPPYVASLNPEQRAAVEALDGPVLVLAGAGTGKTRVLTTRLAHLLSTGRAKPWGVLAVTFTNKASREMRERVEKLLGPGGGGLPWLGTFHSISARMLRTHAELVGLKNNFSILDTDDQVRLLKQIIDAEGIDEKRWPGRQLAGLIDGWKNRALTPERAPKNEAFHFADGAGLKLYAIYQARLKILNACDFGDLLLHMIDIFQRHPDVLETYHRKITHMMVDEYQDTNVAQYLWLRLLAQASKNLCVVGDDDQSIYGWRGAEVDNILRFEHDFPGAVVVRLERNYRSTGHILAAASHLIANNRGRLGKTLFTDDEEGHRVKVRGVWDGEGEARLIGDDIEQWVQSNRSYGECAVLVRAAWQMRAFEERFLMLRIPYKAIGGPRFFERAEIRDVHAYLRLIRSEDDDLAFERIVNQPKRGIGESTVQKLHGYAGKPPVRFVTDNGPLFDADTGEVVTEEPEAPGGATRFRTLIGAAREMILTDDLPLKARTALRSFLTDLDRWREQARTMSHVELAEIVLDESGYTEMLRNDKSPQAQTRLENLKELVQSMAQYDTLEAYLEHVSLVLDIESESEGENVQLSTLHAAKGLEFPLVFLPGWEEEVFPSKRSIDESGEKGLEEERRLAYVGITRARESARISFVANRQIYGRWQTVLPSRFIDELPAKSVDAVSETGYGMQAPGVRDMAVEPFSSGYQSPGWRRAQERGASTSKPPMIDGEARLVARSGGDDSSYARGDRIFHEKFGYGRVRSVEGNKLTVDFDKAGEKRVIDSFVRPASAA
ncbi:ATP-dependent helicase [Terricaulis sp.]|uniref:ATP-dependent helicase n=1 Tax=Terricaulis sp. TaxID=2768686 RepID=UPI002AC5F9F4|nr:UvrD-helicase domain-containing protein [Terricaulis sp.]MDZ4691107.1 UvrD-helicase domain-containing protein [Terricaulis sp.]